MDIMLERILSLIPTKENGDFVHGEKKKFAQTIGLKSGNVISDWVMGRSSSYENYIYKISAVYGVSVEWLKGETDEKEKPTGNADGRWDIIKDLVDSLPIEKQDAILDMFVQQLKMMGQV